MILSNKKQIRTGLAGIAVVFILLTAAVVNGEVFDLTDYPSQHPAVDSLRTELFYVSKDSSAWDRMSPLYRSFYQTRTTGHTQIFPKREPLTYNLWLQEKPAELIVVLPGLGGHYSNVTSTAFADLFYNAGYSVLVISSAMNWEFMESASSVKAPGYTPVDAADVLNALQVISKQLDREYPGKIKRRLLLGYSLGALHSLFISNIEYGVKQPLFSRYLAINPPVDAFYAMSVIDRYYMVGAKWDKVEMDRRLKKAVKVYMELVSGKTDKNKKIELDADEAKFLIGVNFHLILGDIIYSIYRSHKLGIINAEYSWCDRNKIYAEINTFSYRKYIKKYLLKVYSEKFNQKLTVAELNRRSSLEAIRQSLMKNPAIRVLHTKNDFLLNKANHKWLAEVLGERLTLFSDGGHLGNFYLRDVQQKIIESMIIKQKTK
ncbi:MAG: hypothetical protein L3J71_09155 [Victivallaceae bacterium]|nr:hypothetical protein [Victivallaceae bacterium]